MPYARYQLRRLFLLWEWEADFRGESAGTGRTLTKAAARRAARNWIRLRQTTALAAQAAPLAEPVRLAA